MDRLDVSSSLFGYKNVRVQSIFIKWGDEIDCTQLNSELIRRLHHQYVHLQ